MLSSGKLCKYFFTQMSVTVLFLVIFEAETVIPEFITIEQFLIYQCILLVVDLLFFLFRSGKQSNAPLYDQFESMSDRWDRMGRLDICNSLISLFLYFAQIGWLLYGNYIYFNLPLDMPSVYNDQTGDIESEVIAAESESHLTADEINSEKWLYIALMTTLTIGYVHLMIFVALIVIFLVYSISSCCLSSDEAQSQVGHLSPVKLWLFIDEGIFSLLDDLDEIENYEDPRV